MIKRLLTIEHLVHLVMIVFALASVGNLWEFMEHGHNQLTAGGIGIALGFGLVAISIMFTRVNTEDQRTFRAMLASMLAMGVLSGMMQTVAYASAAPLLIAILQGFGFPLIGECLLAYATALYSASERQRRAQMADDGMEERINDAISYALSGIDVSSAQRYVEQKAGEILRHKMDQIVARRLGQPDMLALDMTGALPVATRDTAQPVTVDSPIDTSPADEEKRLSPEERRRDMLTILPGFDTPADIDYDKLADMYSVTTRTIRRDIESLVNDGILTLNGHVKVN